jgi:hypothetical protein
MEKWEIGDKLFNELKDHNFGLKIFKAIAALKSKKPINGYFKTELFRGQKYNENEFSLIPGAWDHEHCHFCSSRIEIGMNYWGNTEDITIMCTKCHEYFNARFEETKPNNKRL